MRRALCSWVFVGASLLIGCSDGGTATAGGAGGNGGDSPSSGGNPTTGGSGTGGNPSTGGGGDGGGPESGGGGQGGGANCTPITVAEFELLEKLGYAASYGAVTSPGLGDVPDDPLTVTFLGSGFAPGFNGEATGPFDLSAGADANYATCSRCVLVSEDPDVPGRTFFQAGGTLTVDAASDHLNGIITATLVDVTLVEVTIDPTTLESTVVAGGGCLHLASATMQVAVTVPDEWSCDPSYFADGLCDCGCGALDVEDCADATVDSCQYCDDTGACSTEACPGTIDPMDNATCIGPTPACNLPPSSPSFGLCAPPSPCNPVTNVGCDTAAGEACDLGANGFECRPAPNEADVCEACNAGFGPQCSAGRTCIANECFKFCCSALDCGGTQCELVAGQVGVCVVP